MAMYRSPAIGTLAALVAGGWLLSNMMRGRRSLEPALHVEALREVRMPLSTAVVTAAAFAASGMLLSSQMNRMRNAKSGYGSGSTVEQSIEVDVPVSTAYNQWTQFEEFPRFMDSVEEVKQLDDQHLHWRAVVGGKPKEWDAEITEQIPDQKIAWRSTNGARNAGVVTFHKISDSRTRIMLQMDYEPHTMTERLGDALGAVKRTAKGNLQRFKELMESRGTETGAWRGTIAQH